MSYVGFFQGSASVAGALVGLLFVALSVAPERLQGELADVEHRSTAATAFTALVDALFISLIGLNPTGGLDVGAVVLGTIGVVATCGVAVQLWRFRRTTTLTRNWRIVLPLIMAVYVAQVVSGFVVTSRSGSAGWSTTFVYILFGMGIARSWMLLGMSSGNTLLQRFKERPAAPPASPPEPPPDQVH